MGDKKQSVLIVDDEIVMLKMLTEFFQQKGYEVGIAENGSDALKAFVDTEFDLVVTDSHISDMDGLTLARRIQKWQPETLIFIMTGR